MDKANGLSTEFSMERFLLDEGFAQNGMAVYYTEKPNRDKMSHKAYLSVLAVMEADWKREYQRLQYHFPNHGGYRLSRTKFHEESGSYWFLIMAHKR